MYEIYLDGQLFYDPRIPELALSDLSCELEVNKTGTLKFTVPATHPLKEDLQKMYSELSLYQDGEWIYSGRVLSDETDFYGNRSVECEGELSYLLDSIQRYHEYHDISVKDYFSDLIAKHNGDVDSRKQFTVGDVTVKDNNDSLYRYSTYENTWKTIEDRLISRLGGYVRIRREDGKRIIDYIEDYGHTNDQVIRFGENILDLVSEVDCDSLATVIVPLGQRDEETDERLTIKSVNGGKDYIEDTDAIAKYGRIVKVVEYDDVTLPENLLRKGKDVLNRQKLLIASITITAIDLHLIDVDIERCKVGDNIRVVSEPHGMDDFMVVQKVYMDLLNPQNSKLTLGVTAITLASSMSRGTAAVLTSLAENFTAFKHVVTDKLQATNADIGALHAELGEFDNLLAQKANVTDLNATNANVENLQAADAEIQKLVAEKAGIEDLKATNADVKNLKAATGNIESLLAGNAGVGTLQAIHLTGDNIVIEDATIAQAVMDDLMAGNVTAAMIYTDFIKIGSKDGAFSIDGATMQIKDTNGTVRVQIGRDAKGNFSYYLWDAAGKLIWSPEGIMADGVPDGLIVDSMVANDAAIDGSKLNICSVAKELTEDGSLSVDASHVVMDDTTLEANYKQISTKIDKAEMTTETLQTEFKEVQGKIEQKVWKSDIKEATDPLGNSITELSDQYTSQQQTIDGIQTEIGDVQTSLESKADGSTVQALTGRVNKVEETASGFSRTISEIKTEVQGTVTDVAVYYALNNSETIPPAEDDPGWSMEAPEWSEGMFMWQKTVTTYASGSSRSDITLTSWYEATTAAFNKASAAQDSVDQLELGGRNMLLNSSFTNDYDKWSNNGHEIVTEDGIVCGHIAGVLKTTKNISQSIFDKIKDDNLTQFYTISADIKLVNYVAGTTNPYVALYVSGQYDNNGTPAFLGATYVGGTIKGANSNLPPFNNQGWVRVTYIFRFSHKPLSMNFYIYSRDWEGDLYYRNVKLERGNKTSDWTPAPEDTTQEITDSAELIRTYAESLVEQKADEIQISISTVTGTLTTDIQDTKDALAQANESLSGSVDTLSQRVADQEDALLDYKHETSTYFRFNANGLNIGKQEDGDESPYSINIDNEKMAFLQNGNEIAYVQYNKMHINAIEAMDRMSVGAAADGGYFDFISTIYGMGVKWRAVTQTATTAKAAKLAARPSSYQAVTDDEGVFSVDFGGDNT